MSRKRVASNEPLANQAKKHKSDSYIIQNNLRDELIITIYSLKRQLFSNDDNNLNLKETLLRLNDKTAKISIECQENYNLASLLSSNANPLKGKDCRIYHALKRANEELDLDNKFYFLFAFYSGKYISMGL